MLPKAKKLLIEDIPRPMLADRAMLHRNAISMGILVGFGIDHGLSAQACLSGTSITEKELVDPNRLVSADEELRLIRNLVRLLGHEPRLGLEAGLRYHFSAFGMLGFAAVSSQTMHEAITFAVRYFDLTFAISRFHVSDIGDETWISFDGRHLPRDVRHFVVDRDCAAVLNVQREIFPSLRALKKAELTCKSPLDTSPYVSVFGLEPEFGAPVTRLVMDRSQLLQPLPQANPLARMAAEAQCQLMLDRRRVSKSLIEQVEDHLSRDLSQMPTMDKIAGAMHMTSRTLRRHLDNEGTNFEKLRAEVRIVRAEEMLRNGDLSIRQIAAQLSFASPSPFIRSFKAWTGETPLQYRKRRRATRD